MGTVYSAFLFVYTVCMIPGGAFIDRFGPRVALAAMGFGSAIFGALTGAVGLGFGFGASALLTFGVIRGLMGLTTTPLHPGCARSVNDWIPLPQRSWANGLVTGAALLGIACTYRVFGALIDAVDWPGAFLITAICTAILTSLWFGCSSEPVGEMGRAGDSPAPIGDPPTGMGEAAVPNTGTPVPRLESSENDASESWVSLAANQNLLLLTLSYAAVGYFQYLFFFWESSRSNPCGL